LATNRELPNEETLWVVYFELAGSRALDLETESFPSGVKTAKKLDDRDPLPEDRRFGRVMISGINDQGWFCIIDAAMS
jgi:hypothetical protein